MTKITIKTDDPFLGRDLKEADIPGLNIDHELPVFGHMHASVDGSTATDLGEITISIVSRLALPLLLDWLRDRKKKGNRSKLIVDGEDVTENPGKASVFNNCNIQQVQINGDNKSGDQK